MLFKNLKVQKLADVSLEEKALQKVIDIKSYVKKSVFTAKQVY